uniref:Uncharacterized protein n=1 Tax=uncultured marine virus TaxID=186617 RepID=S4TDP5_9VIRU|nr:hypothetical protein [uncultured marine virus]
MAKIEPAVTQLLYLVPDGTSYIDLAKDLSKVNRRLYRQGYTYVVQDIQIGVSAGMRASDIQQLSFYTAGNSWIVHNAWKKGFAAWRRQVREVANVTGIKAGTWNDFKVYLDDSMEDATTLQPYAGDAALYLPDESSTVVWDYSALVFDDDGTEKDLKMHLIGSSNLADTNEESGIGLIHEYANSRVFVDNSSPDTPTGASDTIYAKLMGTDEMSDRLVDNIETANDSPPYQFDEYPGGATNADSAVPVRFASVSGAQSLSTVGGFIAPCGLIKVDSNEMSLTNTTESATDLGDVAATGVASPGPLSVYQGGTAPTAAVLVTVASGPYRGVLAAPMGQ